MIPFKDDWPAAEQRFLAWWQGEVLDRVCLQVYAPRSGLLPRPVPRPATLPERWTNAEYLIAASEESFRATFYGGEAYPFLWISLGPDAMAAYLGCDLCFAEDTSWSVPSITDWDHVVDLRLRDDNRWWRLTRDIVRTAVQASQGRYPVSLTDIHSDGDLVAALRGPQNLCLDLVLHPEEVKRVEAAVAPAFYQVFDELHHLTQGAMRGSWLNYWHPARFYLLSCDFSCMVSPAMFREFFLPEIARQARWLDACIYHVDGPGAVAHLDALLEIPVIRGIEWVPGTRAPSMLPWLPMLKRIQTKGRLLHLSVVPGDVETLVHELRPEGLMLATTVASEEEARELLARVTRWSARAAH